MNKSCILKNILERKRPIQIILSKCRRCGKPLATASRSIWGIDPAIRQKYQLICDKCLKPEEKKELEQASVEAVKRNIRS